MSTDTTEIYVPDVPGAQETRKAVRFFASEMNRVHGVPDSDYTQMVDRVETLFVNKLPGVSLSVAAWALFVFGDLLAAQARADGEAGIRGLFWQAVADGILTREETRASVGTELYPRPERVIHEPGKPCTCGEIHEEQTAEEMIKDAKRVIEMIENHAPHGFPHGASPQEIFDLLKQDLRDRGVEMPEGLTPPPGAVGGYAISMDLVAKYGEPEIMRYIMHKLIPAGQFTGVVDEDDLAAWLRDNPA